MNKIIWFGVFFIFLLGACATQQKQTPEGYSDETQAKSFAEDPDIINNLEKELLKTLADSKVTTVHREGDLLSMSFQDILAFDPDSIELKPGLHLEVNLIASVLAKYPEATIRVEGHTDNHGSQKHNLKLSEQRAVKVRNLLFDLNVGNRWIEAVGYGESKPISSNDTEEGRSMNRRVEIKLEPLL